MIFEITMLICFGASWPFAIFKTLKTKTVKGISPLFYILVFIGYISGIIYKLLYSFNYAIWFYIANGIMVLFQIILFFYYSYKEKKNMPPSWV